MTRRVAPILLLSLAFGALVVGALLTAYQMKRTRDGRSLQAALAHLPTGIAAADADRLLGPPDRVATTKGVLVNGVMFLTASNPKAKKYGQLRTYEHRIWKRGTGTASVFVDASGRVAGRVFTD